MRSMMAQSALNQHHAPEFAALCHLLLLRKWTDTWHSDYWKIVKKKNKKANAVRRMKPRSLNFGTRKHEDCVHDFYSIQQDINSNQYRFGPDRRLLCHNHLWRVRNEDIIMSPTLSFCVNFACACLSNSVTIAMHLCPAANQILRRIITSRLKAIWRAISGECV